MKNSENQFRGVYTAVTTPFTTKEAKFDPVSFRRQIEFQVASGVDGIVPVGTTGESPTLDYEEHIEVIAQAVTFSADSRVDVIAGTGANSTKEAVYLTQEAEKVGADASLQVAPYYNKPSQEGLLQHFRTIAKATKLPIILYSIPGRCGVEIAVETVRRLAEECWNIVGIKEAGGNVERVSQLRETLRPNFTILCGDDSLTLPFMAAGAQGVVSVVSNILPRKVNDLFCAAARSDLKSARRIHAELYPISKALFLEGNPCGVKCAMELLGRDSGILRLPLVPVSPETRDHVRRELVALGELH